MRNHLSLATTFAASLAFVAPPYADFTAGVIAPLTGPDSADGDKVKFAMQAAADEIDKNDGILGDKLVLKFGDDASDPLKSSSVAKDFLDEKSILSSRRRFLILRPLLRYAKPRHPIFWHPRVATFYI